MKKEFRYELKFPIHDSLKNIFFNWKSSNINFKKQHEPRKVNNIYYDCFDNRSALGNIFGLSNKVKFRLRWYTMNEINSKCFIEFKIKNGRIGRKITIPTNQKINEININEIFKLNNLMFNNQNKDEIVTFIGNKILKPKIQITYLRNYYVFNNKIRITYDQKIIYNNISLIKSSISKKDEFNVIEFKFNENDLKTFIEINRSIPFSYKRFSKYLRALAHQGSAIYF